MKTAAIILLLLCCALCVQAQTATINPAVKKQLDAVYIKDWQYRKYLFNMPVRTRDSLAASFKIKADEVEKHLQALQAANDAENMLIVEQIIKDNESEYPGKSLVGEPTHLVAWSVILHSDKQQKYYPRVNQAFMMGELPETAVATLDDHILAEKSGLQHYGTHFTAVPYMDSLTGTITTRYYISPIDMADDVNFRRRSRGFATTVEQYAEQLGVIYDKRLTPEKLKLMQEEGRKKK